MFNSIYIEYPFNIAQPSKFAKGGRQNVFINANSKACMGLAPRLLLLYT